MLNLYLVEPANPYREECSAEAVPVQRLGGGKSALDALLVLHQ